MARTPRLMLIEPSGTRQEVIVRTTPFRIGRQNGNELMLRDNRISRQQAEIVLEHGKFLLVDNDSRHGTHVNGKRVDRHELQPRDVIDFGVPDSFTVMYAGEESSLEEIIERAETASKVEGSSKELYHLGVLLDVARALHSSLSLEDVLATVVDSAIRVTKTERGVLLMANAAGELEPMVARDTRRASLDPRTLDISSSVLKQVSLSRRELIVTDAGDETAWQNQASVVRLQIHTVVALPLERMHMAESVETTVVGKTAELLGVLYLDSQQPAAAFTDLDRAVLRSLAIEAGTVIENAKLFTATRHMERMQHELEIASDLQRQLLPTAFPKASYFTVAGSNLACQSVGGDYYDVLELPAGKMGFVVLDVAGKGIPAALLASMLQGIMSTAAAIDLTPDVVAARINRYLFERSSIERYATLFYGTLDEKGTFDYVNAGHVPPLVRTASGQVYPLASESFPLGMFDFAEFHSCHAQLSPGDIVLIYTDGFTEASDAKSEFFGEQRLRDHLKQFKGAAVEELLADIIAGVRVFTGGFPQNDDMTLLAFQFCGIAS
ncbi:MAG: SpoIIE family protein phosphatase [Acidipila sp.]|nr:SpoIIE family protein phosphatase [Acidipila sp.]